MAEFYREKLVLACWAYRGTPYIYGGNDPALGADCSGFIKSVLIDKLLLPDGDYTAQMIYNYYKKYKTARKEPGNLLFFGRNINEITHVAIYAGIMDGFDRMIESGDGGKNTITLVQALKDNAQVRINNVDLRQDFVCICDPFKQFNRS